MVRLHPHYYDFFTSSIARKQKLERSSPRLDCGVVESEVHRLGEQRQLGESSSRRTQLATV